MVGSPERRVALAGGGTAGHVYPAIAVAEAYRQVVPHVELLFIGSNSGVEAKLVAARGFHFAALPAAPLYGVGGVGKLRAVAALVQSVAPARRLLAAQRIQLVIGF